MCKGSVVHVKSQVDIEGDPKTEPKSRQMIDEQKDASQILRMNDVVNMKTEVWYGGTTGEGVVQATLSSCGETMAKDKVDDLRVANTIVASRVEEGFRTRLLG